MAHREQHSNREAKKPKKEKPKGGTAAQPKRSPVSEALEVRDNSKLASQLLGQPRRTSSLSSRGTAFLRGRECLCQVGNAGCWALLALSPVGSMGGHCP
jgi:hypothetical protein